MQFIFKLQREELGLESKTYNSIGGSASQSDTSSSSSSTGSETMTPEQQEQYRRLLEQADSFLGGGGFAGTGNEYLGQREDVLKQQQDRYTDVLTGKADEAVLNQSLNAQTEAAKRGLDRQLSGVAQSANMTGGAGGSRAGIAEGVAVGESNAALQSQQANTINQFYQAEEANKRAAAEGLNNLSKGWAGIQGDYMSDADNMAKTLGAYQQLVTGNMGGTTDSESQSESQSSTSTTSMDASYGFSDKNAKKNKEKIGTAEVMTSDGDEVEVDKYEFEYKDDIADEEGLPKGKQVGVLAQDVEKVAPDAVKKKKRKKGKGSLRQVDYSKVDLGEADD